MSKLRTSVYFLAVALLLSGCISIPTGDGGKMKLSKDGVEIEGEDGEKSTIDLDTDEGGLSITTGKDGEGAEVTVNTGSHAQVPDGFPKDISLPAKEFLVMSSSSPKDKDDEHSRNSITLSYQIEGDFVASMEKYDKYLVDSGYAVERIEIGPTMHSLMGTKEKTSMSINIIAEEDQSYMLQFMYFYE